MVNEYPHTIVIEQYTKAQDPNTGEFTETWSTYGTFDAEVTSLTGSEFYEAQKLTSAIDYNIMMDYDSGVNASMRVVFGAITMEVSAKPIPLMPDINGLFEKLNLKCVSS
jgi:SPP1 family predicted phage head-tail adaptor